MLEGCVSRGWVDGGEGEGLLWDDKERLEEGRDGLVRGTGDADADGVLEGGSLEGFDFRGHGCAEEVGVSVFPWENLQDLV